MKTKKSRETMVMAVLSVLILVCLVLGSILFITNLKANAKGSEKTSTPQEQEQSTSTEDTDLPAPEAPKLADFEITRKQGEKDSAAGHKGETTDYIFADSDSRYLEKSELKDLTKEELNKARNEIYARHGRKFSDAALQKYFDAKSWYQGIYEGKEFDEQSENILNEFEKKNAALIRKYEKEKGYIK